MWSTVISWVLGNIPTKGLVIIGGVLLVAALSGGWWYVSNKIETLETTIATEKVKVEQLKGELAKQKLEMYQLVLTEVNKRYNEKTVNTVVKKTSAKVDKKADPVEAVIFSF